MIDKLWAPWRINYIKTAGRKKIGCIFCRNLKSKKKTNIIFRNKYSFAILNIFPYNNGHVMVCPNRHIKDLKTLTNQEVADLFKTLNRTLSLLDKVLKPQGYNLGMNIGKCSGAGIPGHLHLHVVPRWEGDTNFMPTISNTKIISQSLSELFRKLKSNVRSKPNKRIRR